MDARSQSARPAVDDERAYVGGLGEEVVAFSRDDGSVVWTSARDGSLSDSSPHHHDGRVYVGSGGGAIHALTAADGSEIWRLSTDSAIVSSPIVRDGTLYVGRDDGGMLALDACDGSLEWQIDLGAPIYADPDYSAEEELVYVSTRGGQVYALEADTGAKVWSHNGSVDVTSSGPVADDGNGLVYFAANEIVALDANSGQPTWATNFYGANAGSSPTFSGKHVYAAGGNGRVYALSNDGRIIHNEPDWSFRTRGTFVADPVLHDGKIVAVSMEGTLYVLDIRSGEELDRVELPCETRSSPVVVDDEIYLGSRSGTVFAFTLEPADR